MRETCPKCGYTLEENIIATGPWAILLQCCNCGWTWYLEEEWNNEFRSSHRTWEGEEEEV